MEFSATTGQAARTISGFALAYGVLQLFYGPLGDRHGKTRVIGFATLACTMGSVAAALSSSLDWLIASRVLSGMAAAGIIPLTMAWIGDQVPYEHRQAVLARLLGSTVLGMMGGAWAGGAMTQAFGWRAAFFLVAALFFVLGLALALRHLRERRPSHSSVSHDFFRQAATVLGSPWARQLLTVAFVEGALVFGALAFVPSTLHERFHLPLAEAGALVALFGVGGLLYSRVAGRLLRRLGAPTLAATGAACLAIAFLMLAAMRHWSLALPACFLAGLGFYMLHNTLQTCATQLSASARGTGVSMFVCALFIGQSSGVSAAAWVIGRYSSVAWFAMAAPALLALGAYFTLRLRAQLSMSKAVA